MLSLFPTRVLTFPTRWNLPRQLKLAKAPRRAKMVFFRMHAAFAATIGDALRLIYHHYIPYSANLGELNICVLPFIVKIRTV